MSLRPKLESLHIIQFFHKLTLFQGSTLRFLYSFLYFNLGKSPWLCIRGTNANISCMNYNYQLENPRGRAHDRVFYSFGYQDSSPETMKVFASIIKDHLDEIEKVLGADFLLNEPTFWRITHIPPGPSSFDIYSQVFHQDSVLDNFNLQIFVLLQDITPSDGPFEWIEKEHHRKAFYQCQKRDKLAVKDIPVCRLIGKKNDYLILSTGQSLHRDGIPDDGRERVMASIGLFPKYTGIGTPLRLVDK